MPLRYILCAFLAMPLSALADAGAEYLRDVKPVLKERCYACHGALKQKAGLRLDSAERVRAGGKHGEVLSKLLVKITSADPDERMPPEGKALAAEEIDAIRKWLDAGAPVPANEQAEDDPREHWAFQRIERPPVPAIGKANPIDAFLESKRVGLDLKPQPPAARQLLIRRLYLDLVGLPPTLEQLHDERAWENIIDELLASPQHGERWGRHWMDVWRYSDWYGLGAQLRNSQKHLWHWRDWIVESLNADKGYDRMVLEMLAGDELAPGDGDSVRATGFLARNYYLFNRTTWLDSTIEHTGKAFLGLTLNCAKCHDHKYDPITHLDYYRFRAIFEPHQVRLDPVPGETDLEKDGLPRAFDDRPEVPTFLHLRGDEKQPDKDTKIEPGVPAILASFAPEPQVVELPHTAYAPGTRDYVQRDRLEVARRELDQARQALSKLQVEKQKQKPDAKRTPPPASDFIVEDGFDAPDAALWEVFGDDWEYRDGALHKLASTRENNLVLLRKKPPRDFELTATYTTTGGTTYKSIGIRFDRSADGKNQHHVYTSAYESGPKVQVSHTVDGKDQYPESGKVDRPIKVGERYELKFAVRDRLLNVWLNGEFLLAYQLPSRLAGGTIGFSAFDATAAFDAISIRALPADVDLVPAGARKTGSLETAQASLVWREAELASLLARVAADSARHSDKNNFAKLANAAARAEIEARQAKAQLDRLDPKKLKAAEKQLADAKNSLANLAADATSYTPIRASRKALETPEHKFDGYPATYSETSTGRRLALAKWIVHRDNPLTARVAVNHVWLRHFGKPLVESVFDFGRRAKRPAHPDLLDFLAVELIDSGWSFKHLHRLIVTSEAYRLSSSNAAADPATLSADPTNAFYWRANPRRMESQLLRDSLLHLAGALDLTPGGASIDPDAGGFRRSLYFKHSRDDQHKFLSMFDDADFLACYRRAESIMPQQALALSNSKLALEMAGKIAARIGGEGDAFSSNAFETVLCRAPDGDELAACRDFLNSHPRPDRRRAGLVHALLNHNDFVTVR